MKTKFLLFSLILFTFAFSSRSHKENTEDAENTITTKPEKTDSVTNVDDHPGVYFVNLKDGEQTKSPVIIQMGVRGMTVEPAGKVEEGRGHHHIVIDGSFIKKGEVVPMDKTHLHFGKGQTTDTLKLAPGKHTLTLQFANGVHDSYGKDWSKTISITIIK